MGQVRGTGRRAIDGVNISPSHIEAAPLVASALPPPLPAQPPPPPQPLAFEAGGSDIRSASGIGDYSGAELSNGTIRSDLAFADLPQPLAVALQSMQNHMEIMART